jgi:hypothetical protein
LKLLVLAVSAAKDHLQETNVSTVEKPGIGQMNVEKIVRKSATIVVDLGIENAIVKIPQKRTMRGETEGEMITENVVVTGKEGIEGIGTGMSAGIGIVVIAEIGIEVNENGALAGSETEALAELVEEAHEMSVITAHVTNEITALASIETARTRTKSVSVLQKIVQMRTVRLHQLNKKTEVPMETPLSDNHPKRSVLTLTLHPKSRMMSSVK